MPRNSIRVNRLHDYMDCDGQFCDYKVATFTDFFSEPDFFFHFTGGGRGSGERGKWGTLEAVIQHHEF